MKKTATLFFVLLSCWGLHAQPAVQAGKQDSTRTAINDTPKILRPTAFKKALRKTKNAVLLDVRTPDEFAEGHLKNAQNIDYLADEFEAQVSRLDKSKPCFLYCRSGKRTAGAAELMLALGFERIYTLDGGMLAWEEQKLPVVRPATQH